MRLIDADALITELNGIRYPGAPYVDAGIRIAIGKVCDAPTIEERKTGEWILDDEYIDCSACKREKWSRVPYESLVKRFRFCPNCGADMRGETE